ncbi:MAG TPA: peptide chain release factor N(5)-glutamine methyltransferase [Verrucomicrobiae bacterium]
MKVLEVIQRSTDFLARKGIDSPRLQAELLLAHVLGLPRMQLYLNFERALTDTDLGTCREFVKRRGQHEPVQQIIGSTSFCGLEIALNRHVLVPRPETEVLAELGWEFLNHLPAPGPPGLLPDPRPVSALDFGTGSGCLALALAVKCPNAFLHAIDISTEALALAGRNAARHGVANRISFLQGDGLTALAPGMQFDLIIGNPPYIPSCEIEKLEPEVRDYEPRQALDGGADGLDFFRRLSRGARPFVRAGGRLMLEFGDGEAEPIQEIFREQNWVVERVVDDYTHRPRILIARLV